MAVNEGTIAEVIYRYTVNNQICMSVFHYRAAETYPQADPIDVTNSLLNKVKNVAGNTLLNNMADLQSQDVSYLDVSVQLVFPTRYLKFGDVIAKVGTVAQSCEAQNLAAVLTKQTRNAGRNAVGTLHIGGLAVNAYDAGLLTAGSKAALNFIGTAMLADLTEATTPTTWKAALLNRNVVVVDGKKHYPIVGSTPLYTFKGQPELRVMRRRTVGLGI